MAAAGSSRTRLGRMLRLYRAHGELSVRDLAPQIGTSAATVSRIERGEECDVETFLKLLAWMRAPELVLDRELTNVTTRATGS